MASQSKKPKNKDAQLVDLFHHCAHVAVHRGNRSGGRSGTLSALLKTGPVSQRELAEVMNVRAATLSEQIARLDRAGLVERTPSEKDRRSVIVSLSEEGKKEARRYDELMLMLKAGQIRNLRLQQQYTLQESYITETGERVRAIHYVADFAYERPTAPDKYGTVFWLPVVEDVKSRATKTAQYEMKKKLLRERFNLTITEV